ncbi:hypothetical protein BDA96_05G182900 [Sorghum bicolor]|uniref:Pentacotripeptide-repeat region of PRORP domain-containing protein n=1 Tax=Sorghum bicolor TaxID=4558 RepID=A0A921QXZ2_SORBI|nr:hypothetical protein BDA96_05G182900 [Sorghum bicolor]
MWSCARISSAVFTTAACSSPSPRAPHLAFATATARVRKGTFRPEEAHDLFDELLHQATPVPGRQLNGFLAALARAPASAACRDGPALAVALFNRVSRAHGPRVLSPTLHTYGILMDCCTRAHRPKLTLAFFGQVLKTGLGIDTIMISNLLRGLCEAKRTAEALDILLHRMPHLGCVPDVFSYCIVLKSLCSDRKSGQADELLRMMAEGGAVCLPNAVAYNTVIDGFFKEGDVKKACDLFNEMVQRGISPNLSTYNCVVNALCKARAMDKAEAILRQMVDKGVLPDNWTYTSLIYGYSSTGQWKEAVRVSKKMTSQGILPDVVTLNSLMASLCKHGKIKDARDVFDKMAMKGQKTDIFSYKIMLNGYATKGCLVDLTELFNLMLSDGIAPDSHIFNVLIKAYAKCGMLDRATIIFNEMREQGVEPDVVTYSTVIAALCRIGKMDDAVEKFNQMIDQGVAPSISTYHFLIQGFCTHGDLLKAKDLVLQMMNKVGKMENALRVFDVMVSAGIQPNVVVYGTLVNGYCKVGRIDEGWENSSCKGEIS